MRIRCDHLRNTQIGLRQLAHRSWLRFFTTTTAAAAGLFLFRFAAATRAFGHSGGACIRSRLRWRDVDELLNLQIILGVFAQADLFFW